MDLRLRYLSNARLRPMGPLSLPSGPELESNCPCLHQRPRVLLTGSCSRLRRLSDPLHILNFPNNVRFFLLLRPRFSGQLKRLRPISIQLPRGRRMIVAVWKITLLQLTFLMLIL